MKRQFARLLANASLLAAIVAGMLWLCSYFALITINLWGNGVYAGGRGDVSGDRRIAVKFGMGELGLDIDSFTDRDPIVGRNWRVWCDVARPVYPLLTMPAFLRAMGIEIGREKGTDYASRSVRFPVALLVMLLATPAIVRARLLWKKRNWTNLGPAVRHALYSLTVVLSLICFTAVIALGIASYWCEYTFSAQGDGARNLPWYTLDVFHGGMSVLRSMDWPPRSPADGNWSYSLDVSTWRPSQFVKARIYERRPSLHGVFGYHDRVVKVQEPWLRRMQHAFFPAWALAAVTGVAPVLWWRGRRPRRWRKTGCCEHCGYDLRMTPNCCPECGEVPGRRRRICVPWRAMFNIATVVSSVLLIASVILWRVSYGRAHSTESVVADEITRVWSFAEAWSRRGNVRFGVGQIDMSRCEANTTLKDYPPGTSFSTVDLSWDETDPWRALRGERNGWTDWSGQHAPSGWMRRGFGYFRAVYVQPFGLVEHRRFWLLPWWSIATVFALLPVGWIASRLIAGGGSPGSYHRGHPAYRPQNVIVAMNLVVNQWSGRCLEQAPKLPS